jgi:hypothetical protein
MKKENLVPVVDIYKHYHAKPEFINSLKEFELIEITTIEEKEFIHYEELLSLERLVRLHYDLDINLEGIDVINHLLQRIESMQSEMVALKNKLRMLEDV